jgi:Big-like domain-containing protein
VEGVSVSFTAAPQSGSVAAQSATTNGDGIASTTWTLGTTAGDNIDTVRASISGLSQNAIFIATVTAAAPAAMSVTSGDVQNAPAGEPLPQPLTVSVTDQYGNPTRQIEVTWSVTSGGGSISPSTSATDEQGQASASWSLGSQEGAQTASATIGTITGLATAFSATAVSSTPVVLTTISPDPLVEGESATLTGTGFGTTAAANTVKIDGVDVPVTTATATSLTVTVPTFNCLPARPVSVAVNARGRTSDPVSQNLRPRVFTSIGVGQQLVIQEPGELCLQFSAASSTEDYLIGVQSTSEDVNNLTPATLTATAAPGPTTTALPELTLGRTASGPARLQQSDQAKRWTRHFESEMKRRLSETRLFSGPARALTRLAPAAGGQTLAIPPDVAPGDVVDIRVPLGFCEFTPISAAVKVVGKKGVWLEDIDDPDDGFTDNDIKSLSSLLDRHIYPTDVDYFGTPSDLDDNGRIVIVITKEVNKVGGALGFTFAGDLFSRAECASSNEGEYFYSAAVDPVGTYLLGPYSRQVALHDAPFIIAHEFTHIIQVSRRIARQFPAPLAIWEGEGQAVLAQEVVGHAVEGRSPRHNYGEDIAFNQDDPSSIDWYSYGFIQAATYFGYDGSDTRVPGAPEQCSWLNYIGPCLPGSAPYGAPWLLLRWLSDQYGPTFPGGEKGLQKALIEESADGYANIENVVGVPIATVLAQWASALYTDDRFSQIDRRLTLPSWNLFEIYGASAPEPARLVPRSRTFESFRDDFSVRAGSSAYFRVSGGARPATAIRVRTPSDNTLPANMQLFVVRLH